MSEEELQVLQGTLDVLVLKGLSQGAEHGFGIARWIRRVAGDELHLEDRALYLALHRMEERAWIASQWGVSDNNRRAKYYQLTPAGRMELERQVALWERYTVVVNRVLQWREA